MKEVNREREELLRRVGSECRWEGMIKMGECDGMGGSKGGGGENKSWGRIRGSQEKMIRESRREGRER